MTNYHCKSSLYIMSYQKYTYVHIGIMRFSRTKGIHFFTKSHEMPNWLQLIWRRDWVMGVAVSMQFVDDFQPVARRVSRHLCPKRVSNVWRIRPRTYLQIWSRGNSAFRVLQHQSLSTALTALTLAIAVWCFKLPEESVVWDSARFLWVPHRPPGLKRGKTEIGRRSWGS